MCHTFETFENLNYNRLNVTYLSGKDKSKDDTKVLSHRQKQRAHRRLKKKAELKEKKKELKAQKNEEKKEANLSKLNGFAGKKNEKTNKGSKLL